MKIKSIQERKKEAEDIAKQVEKKRIERLNEMVMEAQKVSDEAMLLLKK